MGYYQTLHVEGVSIEDAELKAVELIRNDQEIKAIWVKEKQKKPPQIFAEEIFEIEEFNPTLKSTKSGRSLYYAKQWWQFWK